MERVIYQSPTIDRPKSDEEKLADLRQEIKRLAGGNYGKNMGKNC